MLHPTRQMSTICPKICGLGCGEQTRPFLPHEPPAHPGTHWPPKQLLPAPHCASVWQVVLHCIVLPIVAQV